MKNVKRVFLALTALGVVACSASAFAACGEHEHEWGDWSVTTEATCDVAGLKERVCSGDPTHKETEVIPALGHDWDEWEDKGNADCSNAKTQERTCKNDPTHKDVHTVGEPDATAHDWGEWTDKTDATCTSGKMQERTCGHDATHKETRTVGEPDATAHKWSDWTDKTAADCENAKVEERVCGNNPEHKETRTVGEADATAHKWGDWTLKTAADCENAKVEERVCGNNPEHKETRTVGEPDATAHKWSDWTDKTDANCTSGKTQERTCEHNPEHKETRTVGEPDTTAHKWGDWTLKTVADCENARVEERVCGNNPEHKETRTVGEPLGHDWGEWEDKVSATCMTAKQQERVCGHDSKHKETRTVGEPDATAHKWSEWTLKSAADCENAKVEERVCEYNREHTETRTVDEALGHDWDDGSVTTPATCTTEGIKTFTCKRDGCEKTKTEPIEAKHGELLYHAQVDATPSATGTKEYWSCKVCGQNFSDAEGKNIIVTPEPLYYQAPALAYGPNTVTITDNDTWVDAYEFTPEETKKYSMTVPEGVEVLMNDNDFLVGETVANFEATQGQKITFVFKYSAKGEVTVAIGEAVAETVYPTITTENGLTSANKNAVTFKSHAATVIEVGDIAEGKYTLTIKVGNGAMRNYVVFGKNTSENYDDYFLANGNTVSGSPADVSFQFPRATVLNNTAVESATFVTTTWTVTLNLKKGDKLVFVHAGSDFAPDLTLTAA